MCSVLNNFSFVNPYELNINKDNFICNICTFLLYEPVLCNGCLNMYCKNCYIRKANNKEECDSCITPTKLAEEMKITEITKYHKSLLNRLTLKCKINGCLVDFSNASIHIKKKSALCKTSSYIKFKDNKPGFQITKTGKFIDDYIKKQKNRTESLDSDNTVIDEFRNVKKQIQIRLNSLYSDLKKHDDMDLIINNLRNDVINNQSKDSLKININKEINSIQLITEMLKPEILNSSLESNEIQDLLSNENLLTDDYKAKCQNDHTLPITCILTMSAIEFISGAKDSLIKVWEMNNKNGFKANCVCTLIKHEKEISNLIKLENTFMSSGLDGYVYIWKGLNYQYYSIKTIRIGFEIALVSLFSADMILCRGEANPNIILWSLNSNDHLYVKAHEKGITSLIDFNNELLVSSGSDNLVKIWCKKENQISILNTITVQEIVNAILKISETIFLTKCGDKFIKIWDINKLSCLLNITPDFKILTMTKVDNNKVIFGDSGKIISLWSIGLYNSEGINFEGRNVIKHYSKHISLSANSVTYTEHYPNHIIIGSSNINIVKY